MPPKNNRITAEDLYRFQNLSEPRLSPDGSHVVYTVQRVERKTEKKYTNLWVAPTLNGKPRQFTYGEQNDYHPRWSPDGSTIAFLSNRGNKEKPAQVYLLPFAGGEACKLSDIEGSINDLQWSPDGKSLLCSVQKTDADELEREKDEQKKKLGVVARHYERVFYKFDGVGYLPHERQHLWSVDARNGKAKQLTDHKIYDENFPAFSPDGKWIAFISNRSVDPDFNVDADDLWVMPAKGGELRKIETPIGGKQRPSFSPDGKWIAYYGQEGEGLWYKNVGIWQVPADGSAAPVNLTEQYDLHASSWTINDQGTPEEMPPTWAKDGSAIYFPVSVNGSSCLVSVARDGSNLQTVIGKGGVVGSFNFDKSQTKLAYFYGTMDDPCQVRFRDLRSAADRQLTDQNAFVRGLDLGSVEEIWFKGPAGNDLQGWIMKPPSFDPAQKYPTIIEIHGGPLVQYGEYFMHEFYYLASKGFVVCFSNPRGGRGYGEAHAGAIHGAWGTVDYDDLMAFADVVESQPFVDKTRIGVTGGSYGGYMTVWIIGHTTRFKAAVTQRCVSNFLSMWGSSDLNWTFQQELDAAQPFKDFEKYWKMSPIAHIGNAKTPTLVIHNEFDLRCPIEQGEQVFVALRSLGVESEFVRFPDEFHGLSRTGRTDRRIARLNHILRWFESHL